MGNDKADRFPKDEVMCGPYPQPPFVLMWEVPKTMELGAAASHHKALMRFAGPPG